jgi:RNA polymerase sigma-70 factor (ECF subfamily)
MAAGEGIAQPREDDAPARVADFDQLVALHEPRIRRLAFRLLGWSGDVDDVVQDVFLAALARIGKFRGDASIATWLTSITINRCRTDRRRRLLRLRWLARRAKPESAQPADQRSMRDEVSARVRSAVRALRPKDREVIVLFYLEDFSAQHIAELLSISRGAVEVRLHRARARLKNQLAEFMKD